MTTRTISRLRYRLRKLKNSLSIRLRLITSYPYRYTINTSECGGIVIARTEKKARKALASRYRKYFPDKMDIQVWPAISDDYYEPKHPGILDCYGD